MSKGQKSKTMCPQGHYPRSGKPGDSCPVKVDALLCSKHPRSHRFHDGRRYHEGQMCPHGDGGTLQVKGKIACGTRLFTSKEVTAEDLEG